MAKTISKEIRKKISRMDYIADRVRTLEMDLEILGRMEPPMSAEVIFKSQKGAITKEGTKFLSPHTINLVHNNTLEMIRKEIVVLQSEEVLLLKDIAEKAEEY